MYNGNPATSTPVPIPLQWKNRLPISLSLVLGLGPQHLLDEHSLVLSLSANVWVYWCAVTGPGWSYPTRIRASCCVSSVSVCVLIAANSKHRLLKNNAPSTFSVRPAAHNVVISWFLNKWLQKYQLWIQECGWYREWGSWLTGSTVIAVLITPI